MRVKGFKRCKITDWLQSDQNKFENVLRLPEWHLRTTVSQCKEATTLRKVAFNGHFIEEHYVSHLKYFNIVYLDIYI